MAQLTINPAVVNNGATISQGGTTPVATTTGALTSNQFNGQAPVATSTPATTTKPTVTPTSTPATPVGSTPTAPAGMTPAQTAAWNAAVALIPKTPAQNTNQSTQNTNQNTQNTNQNTQNTSTTTGNTSSTPTPATYDLQTGEGLYSQPADSTKINTTLQPPAGYMVKYDSNDNAVLAPMTAQDKLDANSADEDATTASFNTALSNLENGVTPLNPAEQAQVDQMKQQYAQMIQSQTGLSELAGYRTGAAENANFYSDIAAKTTALQVQEAGAIAKLTSALQANDISEIKDAYDAVNKNQEDKSALLQKAVDTVNSNAAAVQKEADTQAQMAETAKKDAADIQHQQNADYLSAQGSWTIHDNPDGSQSLVNDKTGAVQNLSSNNIITGTGSSTLMTTDSSTGDMTLHSGNPLLDNNFQSTSSGIPGIPGIPYIDVSSLTGEDLKNATESAAKLGIPVIDKTNSPLVQNIETARTNIQDIADELKGVTSSNWATRPFNAAGHLVENILGSNTNLAALSSSQGAYMTAVKAMLGLKTIPRGVTTTLMDNMPSENDTTAVAATKLATINKALDAAERGIFGATVTDKYNPSNPTNVLNTYVNGGSSSSGNSTSSLDSLFNANTQ